MTLFWLPIAADTSVTLPWAEVLGPTGALVLALIGIIALWREDRRVYKERIADLTAQRDFNAAGWKAQTDANAKLAEAWSQRQAERRRHEDAR